MGVTDIDQTSFDDEVIKSSVPVVVDLYADWCGPCRLFTPIFDEISLDFDGKVKFVKMNVDNSEDIAKKFNIMSIPTTLLIEKGKLKAMNVGAIPKEALKRWIEKNL